MLCNEKIQTSNPFLLGAFILSLFFFVIIDTTLLFAFGVAMSALNLLLAVVCSSLVSFILSGRSLKRTATIVLAGILVLGISMLLSARVYDCSWDGNRYHKSITGLLKYGWNPLQTTFYDFAQKFSFLAEVKETWYDAYPKGTEIWAASLYAITNNIEVGKNFNILSTIASFFICYALLSQTKLLTFLQSALCSLFCALNPVTLAQICTYYTDGFLWQVFLVCMGSLLYVTFYEGGSFQSGCMYLIFISITLGLNTKFSALLYFGILCLCFFGFWIVSKRQKIGWQNSKKWIGKRFLFFVTSVICGAGFAGATSYGINLMRHANPVYTMIGEGSTEIITAQLPKVYKSKSHIVRFIASLFSKTTNNKALESIEWKFPFTYSAAEFSAAQAYDTRIAGWGLLFSGILLLSLIVLWIAESRLENKVGEQQQKIVTLGKLLFTALALSIVVVPGLCWARYNGALFYIPIGALVYLFAYANRNRQAAILPSFVAGALSIVLALNMMPNLMRIGIDYRDFSEIHNQLIELKEIADKSKTPVKVGYATQYRFEGRFFSLYDMNITNFVYTTTEVGENAPLLFNRNGLYYEKPEGQ